LNLDGSIHQPNSLLHAHETETSALPRRFQVEPSSQIFDEKMDITRVFPQLHLNVSHPAVLGGIAQGFL
jgi:hypothetical protein